jgi:hypothetical protein
MWLLCGATAVSDVNRNCVWRHTLVSFSLWSFSFLFFFLLFLFLFIYLFFVNKKCELTGSFITKADLRFPPWDFSCACRLPSGGGGGVIHAWLFKIGPKGCSETLGSSCWPTARNIPEERRSPCLYLFQHSSVKQQTLVCVLTRKHSTSVQILQKTKPVVSALNVVLFEIFPSHYEVFEEMVCWCVLCTWQVRR